MSYNTPLVSVNGASLTGDISQGVKGFFDAKNQKEDRDLRKQQLVSAEKQQALENAQKQAEFDAKQQAAQGQAAQKAQAGQLTGQILDPNATDEQRGGASAKLAAIDAETAQKVLGILDIQNTKNGQKKALNVYNTASAIKATAPEKRPELIQAEAKKYPDGSPEQQQLLSLIGMDAEHQNQGLSVIQKSTLPLADQYKLDNPDKTPIEKQLIAAGIDPKSEKGQKIIEANLTKSQVTIDQKGETEEKKASGKLDAEAHDRSRQQAEIADVSLNAVQNAKALLGETKTGELEPLKTKVAAFAQSLGFTDVASDIANVSNNEALVSQLNRLVLQEMSKVKGGANQQQQKILEEEAGSIKDTTQALEFKLNAVESMAQTLKEKYEFVEDLRLKGVSLGEANKAWRDQQKDFPTISRKVRTEGGLPMFYTQFQQYAREKRPGITDEQIRDAWLKKNSASKKNNTDEGAK